MKTCAELVKSGVAEGATNTARPLTHSLDLTKEGLAVDATQTPEEWRPIVGYGNRYEVSNLGRVRSLDRMVRARDNGQRLQPGRILRQRICKDYWGVTLYDDDDRPKNRYVHSLVCAAFHGPRPEGHQARHLNGNNRDNLPENLRWGTQSDNMRDRVEHGTDPHARRTECPQGHEYTPENTYLRPGRGGRDCKRCRYDAGRRCRGRAAS